MTFDEFFELMFWLSHESAKVLNSAFFSAFISALAGAWFGSWGAQRVAERAAMRKELLIVLRKTNSAIVLATNIANQALSLKGQFVREIYEKYFEERSLADDLNGRLARGERSVEPQTFKCDMTHITPLTVPIEALKGIAFSLEMVPGKAISQVSMLELSIAELSHALRVRSEQIDKFKVRRKSDDNYIRDFFGLKRPDGDTDSMFHDSVVAISSYTDDIAFFGSELANELQGHGANVRKRLEKLMTDVPRVNSVDFSLAYDRGLMPPRERYQDWLSGFKENK